MSLQDAAQQALEALESLQGGCTDSDDGTVEAITVWCPEVIDALRAALAENKRDWSLLEATQESLREHMAEIQTLRAALAQPASVEPFGYLWPTGMHPEFRFYQQKRDGVDGMPLYSAPQPTPAQPDCGEAGHDEGRCGNAGCSKPGPVGWRAHVEQRLKDWRQRTMNRSGDRLALDDMMGQDSIDDLIDYVCDQWAEPAASFEEWFTRGKHDKSDRFIAGLAWNAGMDCAVQSPLTEEKIIDLWAGVSCEYDDEINIIELARAIEAAHGIKEQP